MCLDPTHKNRHKWIKSINRGYTLFIILVGHLVLLPFLKNNYSKTHITQNLPS